jgi:ABC-type lipoprotein release transport system permease subunit
MHLLQINKSDARWVALTLTYDPLSLFMAIAVLSTAAVLASFLPARRAASIDPMQALKAD